MRENNHKEMKIAIMGAGLSGLACAFTLEKNGITPTIFEKSSEVGDRFINAEAFLSIITRPVVDVFQYFSEEFQLYLSPSSHINKLTVHSENNKAVIQEQIGHVDIRGRHQNSLEKQIENQIKSKIIFNSEFTYDDLLHEYTHVVLATGDAEYASELHNFKKYLTVSLKGATVEGDFDQYETHVWLNNQFSPNGYAYLLPFSDKEANIVIACSDPVFQKENEQRLWNRFFDTASQDLKQSLNVTDHFQITNYMIGQCLQPRIGNTFFTGNCFGTIMPFIGFGQFESILSGIYAAYDMCGKGNYEELMQPFQKSFQNSFTLHQAMKKLNNSSFDFIVKNLDGYLGRRLFKPTQRDPLKVISYLLRPVIKMSQ